MLIQTRCNNNSRWRYTMAVTLYLFAEYSTHYTHTIFVSNTRVNSRTTVCYKVSSSTVCFHRRTACRLTACRHAVFHSAWELSARQGMTRTGIIGRPATACWPLVRRHGIQAGIPDRYSRIPNRYSELRNTDDISIPQIPMSVLHKHDII